MAASVKDIRGMLSKGYRITWTGSTANGRFSVKLVNSRGHCLTLDCSPETWTRGTLPHRTVGFAESDSSTSKGVSIVPPYGDAFMKDRIAAVFGVNIGGDCKSGACKRYTPIQGCAASYDIETSIKDVREGGFPLPDNPILSIACVCSCGEDFYASSKQESDESLSLVHRFVKFILDHKPMWLIGWNCYDFDNECMRYHCSAALQPLFKVSRIGTFGKPKYGSLLNIIGTYNVDLMVFMKRALYSMPSFKLADVARVMGATQKTDMPDMRSTPNPDVLKKYNLNDCVVSLDIWKKGRFEEMIPSIALCSSSPIYDCCRYVTGTMATNAYSSHMLSIGVAIEWNPAVQHEKYAGGYVMEPVEGLHQSVVVCDFSSMYPTIMSSCNVNPHDCTVEEGSHEREVGTVELEGDLSTVWLKGKRVTFNRSGKSEMAKLMEYLIAERSTVMKTHPMHAKSMKVLTNSMYGNIGYSASWMYSPVCAASVTAIGRHCVKMAREHFEARGLKVIYMDTDSCMVSGDPHKQSVYSESEESLLAFHQHISSMPVREMKMVVEEHFKKSIMLNKKKYCMLRDDGSMKIVGVSVARKDVSQLCKEAANTCIRSLFMDSKQEAIDSISSFVYAVQQMAVHRQFTLSDVSRYTKRDGVSGYQYHNLSKDITFVPEKEAVLDSVVDYDADKVLLSICAEIERFSIPCGLGAVSDITRNSTVF